MSALRDEGAGAGGHDGRDHGIDLIAVLRTLRRRKTPILATAVVVTSLVVLAALLISPRYTATAAAMIEPRETRSANMRSIMEEVPAWPPEDESAVATQLRVLGSRSHARRVIDELGLLHDPEFNPALRPAKNGLASLTGNWLPDTWLIAAGLADQRGAPGEDTGPRARVDASRTEPGGGNAGAKVLEATIDSFLAKLEVKQDGRSHIVSVSFTSRDPEKAARIANEVVEAFIEGQLEAKVRAADRAIRWVADRLKPLREEVLQAERAVEDYRAVNDLVPGRDGSLETQQLVALNAALADARAERTGKAAILDRVRQLRATGGGYEALAEFASSPTLANLRQRGDELRREEARLSMEYGPRHPLVLRLQAEKQELAGKMEGAAGDIVRDLENEVAVARGRERALEESLTEAKARSALAGRAAVQLRELEREAAAKLSVYQEFLARLDDIRERRDLLESTARVISTAAVPHEPSFPDLKVMTAVGFTGSLMLGVLLAGLVEHLDRGLRTGRQVERALGVPALGLVPTIERLKRWRMPHRYLFDRPLSAYAESIKAIDTALQSSVFGAPQVVLVTSTLPAEGKTTLAMSLGASAARSGRKTLVMDLDLRHPSVVRLLKESSGNDLVENVISVRHLDIMIVKERDEPNLDVMSVRDRTASPSGVLGLQKMKSLLAALRHRYEYIVVDAPPTIGHTEAKIAALLADAVLFVVQWQKTSEASAVNAIEALAKIGAPLVGAVLTQVKLHRHVRYGYSDEGHYYGTQTKYYAN